MIVDQNTRKDIGLNVYGKMSVRREVHAELAFQVAIR
jgi:hypothetical protein